MMLFLHAYKSKNSSQKWHLSCCISETTTRMLYTLVAVDSEAFRFLSVGLLITKIDAGTMDWAARLRNISNSRFSLQHVQCHDS